MKQETNNTNWAELLGGAAGHTRRLSKIRHRVASGRLAANENAVRAGRAFDGELIKRQALAVGGDDARARRVGERQRAHRDGAERRQSAVVGHFANDDGYLFGTLVLHQLRQLRSRHRRSVGLRHTQASIDNIVELASRSARQKCVQLRRDNEYAS